MHVSNGIYILQVDFFYRLLDLEDQLLADARRKKTDRAESEALPLDKIYTYEEVFILKFMFILKFTKLY